MTFLTPWALAGLLAAAVPILLHLVQRREPPERSFPAVRYLEDATRDHRQRLRLRNLILLALRTMLIIALVLAAAGPLLSRNAPLGRHAPSALVLVVDNSASSAAVVDGSPTLDELVAAARRVLDRATPADRLWLLLADGTPRIGSAAELRSRLEGVTAAGSRMDLGLAITQAQDLVAGSGRRGEVVVVTDGQLTAVSPYRGDAATLVLRVTSPAPPNRGVTALAPLDMPWGPEGGRVTVLVGSSDSSPVAVSLSLPDRRVRDVLLTPGLGDVQRITPPSVGWSTLSAALPPDEFRADDAAVTAMRVAPPAAVRWERGARFLDAALDVLTTAGRVIPGDGIRIGAVGGGPSLVLPTSDAARMGALNRQLAARDIPWRYGAMHIGAFRVDSTDLLPAAPQVFRRIALEPQQGASDVLLTVDGQPWAVRAGDVILLGSLLDPEWTELPVSAAFVPWLDAVLTRVIHGVPAMPHVVTGTATFLPPRITRVMDSTEVQSVEGGAPWTPLHAGVYWLLDGADTVGAIQAMLDPRESMLQRATPGDLAGVWPDAVIADVMSGAERAFGAGGRGDLRPLLLLIALGCVVGESVLARGQRRG